MSEDRRTPEGVDPTKPNSARIYDYMLGGKDNYEVDRKVAQRMLEVAPDTRPLAWFSRQFLLRATQIAAEAGVRQFLDLGSGIPTEPTVHEVAQKIEPTARVVAVDYDPVVFAHANALLAGAPGITPILADARDPEHIIEQVRSEGLIDFDEPVGVLMVGVLHFIMDAEGPADIVARYRDALAPGSYFGFTHGGDESNRDFIERSSRDTAGSPSQVVYRSRAQVAAMFDGFEILEPGVVPLQEWLGGDLPSTELVLLGGVCRKP
ncbi:SAM-dependent methyltransferase [Nocardia sp. CDC159]|uniref:SAM-dependent methyltransferase n=1 Tax=Nocardia pulmonis TaxID=2951408 RepID=A0A9X2E7E8_9NOCA|nr:MULTISPECIES: SAM-dependent methyltransferase [Nocardia]MCM6774240.1 SAM-dependent methyltransferase [Nocardia pulmonis]MCM6787127.1 SAM-dependent methyltransferase [Nocardia sp. CDC159]